jgi:hypothetical protein
MKKKPSVDSEHTVEFLAYLPPIQSAIRVSGEGDTMRLQLEISLRTSPEAFRIAMFTGKRLKVTIQELTEIDDETKQSPKSGSAKLDSRRTDLRHHE